MLSRNMVHCDNEEMEIQEEKVICKEGMFSSINVSTGYQPTHNKNVFLLYI